MRRELIAIALVLTGCTRELCGRNSDCTGGQVCSTVGLCAVPADAATAGTDDAGAAGDARPPPDAPQTESQ